MVASNSTAGPTYHVDVVRGEYGISYNVMRCELVAQFDSEEHAAFLCELLLKEQQ
jgi:citrate lyase alpha subunit